VVTWVQRLQAACTAIAAVAAPIGVYTVLQKAILAAAAQAAAAAALLGGAAKAVGGAVGAGAGGWVLGWPMVVLAALALYARYKLAGLLQRFYFLDYVHANVA